MGQLVVLKLGKSASSFSYPICVAWLEKSSKDFVFGNFSLDVCSNESKLIFSKDICPAHVLHQDCIDLGLECTGREVGLPFLAL